MSEFNNLIGMLNDKNDIILSQQAKIDELQKRIDEAMKMLAHGEGYGYEQCTRLAINILKGNKDEN